MSSGRLGIPVEKVTLNLFKGDFDALGELFPENHRSHTLRTVVRRLIVQEAERKGVVLSHIQKEEPKKEVVF